jgi:hypothetical protein
MGCTSDDGGRRRQKFGMAGEHSRVRGLGWAVRSERSAAHGATPAAAGQGSTRAAIFCAAKAVHDLEELESAELFCTHV